MDRPEIRPLTLFLSPNQREAEYIRQSHVQPIEVGAREMIRIMLNGDVVDLDYSVGGPRLRPLAILAYQSLRKGQTDATPDNPER